MSDYKKDIIMVYHIPIDGMTKQNAEEQIYTLMKEFKTGDFYREYFLPKRDSGGKIDIEIINLKGQKTEHIKVKFEKLEDTMMKYYEPEKWKRKHKIQNLLKWK